MRYTNMSSYYSQQQLIICINVQQKPVKTTDKARYLQATDKKLTDVNNRILIEENTEHCAKYSKDAPGYCVKCSSLYQRKIESGQDAYVIINSKFFYKMKCNLKWEKVVGIIIGVLVGLFIFILCCKVFLQRGARQKQRQMKRDQVQQEDKKFKAQCDNINELCLQVQNNFLGQLEAKNGKYVLGEKINVADDSENNIKVKNEDPPQNSIPIKENAKPIEIAPSNNYSSNNKGCELQDVDPKAFDQLHNNKIILED